MTSNIRFGIHTYYIELDNIRDRIRKTIDESRAESRYSKMSNLRLKYGYMPEMEGMDDLIQTKTSFAQSLGSVSYNSKRLHARNK